MTEKETDDESLTDGPTGTDAGASAEPGSAIVLDDGGPEAPADKAVVPRQLGASRYVLAGFFAVGMAVAYVCSRTINSAWNKLADNVWVSQHVPTLTRIAEDDRPTYTMLTGAIIGLLATVYSYRREDVRTWTNEVASELAKVTWPSKKEVTSSTVVVLVTSAFATVFLALLDRFWNFVTNLVYGS
jgi:preprotein translocase subunit SecE